MATLRKETSPIVLIAIVLLGFAFGYFYYSQSLSDAIPQVPPILIPKNDTLTLFKDLKFNFAILDSSDFRSLRVLGESPVVPGSTGRVDIFAPF